MSYRGLNIEDADNRVRRFPAREWRESCGYPSSKKWAEMRKLVGVAERVRDLTAQECILLAVASRWSMVIADINAIMKPKIPTRTELMEWGSAWLEKHEMEELLTERRPMRTQSEKPTYQDLSGQWIANHISMLTGVTEQTVRRKFEKMSLKYSRMEVYGRDVFEELLEEFGVADKVSS